VYARPLVSGLPVVALVMASRARTGLGELRVSYSTESARGSHPCRCVADRTPWRCPPWLVGNVSRQTV
jgi:hypothetical protein